jgi:hypothetical protein
METSSEKILEIKPRSSSIGCLDLVEPKAVILVKDEMKRHAYFVPNAIDDDRSWMENLIYSYLHISQ